MTKTKRVIIKNSLCHAIMVFTVLFFSIAQAEIEFVEPPVRFSMAINGIPYHLQENEPIQIPGRYENPTLSIEVLNTRVFDHNGIRFEFPSDFSWRAEEYGEGNHFITVSGEFLTIQYSWVPRKLSINQVAKEVQELFGDAAIGIGNSALKLGNKRQPGKVVKIEMNGEKIQYEVYLLSQDEKSTSYLAIQYLVSSAPKVRHVLKKEVDIGLRLLAATFTNDN